MGFQEFLIKVITPVVWIECEQSFTRLSEYKAATTEIIDSFPTAFRKNSYRHLVKAFFVLPRFAKVDFAFT